MEKKLTLLERYCKIRIDFEADIKETMPTPAQLWVYQELIYRIGVIQIFQQYSKTAPFSDDIKILTPHYKVVNMYIEYLKNERYLKSPNPEVQKQQLTAQGSLSAVIEDYRRQYANYAPKSPEQYSKDIGRTITTLLPAWIQYRNTITDIKLEEEKNNESK